MTFGIPVALIGGLVLAGCGARKSAQDENKDGNGNGQSTEQAPAITEPTADDGESFDEMRSRLMGEKAAFEARQQTLLRARYDLADRPTASTMFRGKPVQGGVRVRLPEGQTWESLAAKTSAEIRAAGIFPKGFMPLPHVKQEEGGQVIPQYHIDEIKLQEGRDLTRFDIDHDFPAFLQPEFPPAIFLTQRLDLGDVSQGKLVTNQNFWELFQDILTPKQLNGLRLLTLPLAQQQFNLTADRRSDRPSMGISCFDCHANGSTNAAEHLDPVTRPQENRRRLDTPSLRGVNIQRLFGSQRALKSVDDFTQFEQIGAYFDGDPVKAHQKGLVILDRNVQVADMAEFQSLLDFPPAPKLGIDGKLIESLATEQELRGQRLFFGKAECSTCHEAPYYTDNSMHDLKTDRFFAPELINGRLASVDGPIKTFVLRGIKETPPYLHDGRLLTLDDTVEFFNLVLGLKLTTQEKADLVAFMLTL